MNFFWQTQSLLYSTTEVYVPKVKSKMVGLVLPILIVNMGQIENLDPKVAIVTLEYGNRVKTMI